MGNQWLNEIVEILTAAEIPAAGAFPGGERGMLSCPGAAVGLHSADQKTGVLEVEVRILSPRVQGKGLCEETAVAAMEALQAAGWCCRGEKAGYEAGCDCFSMTVLARKLGTGEKLRFKSWVWPENPEEFRILAERSPEYTKDADGTAQYQGLGELCRTITGTGVFRGTEAASSFKGLMALMDDTAAGALVHPVWGSINACLTELKMEPDSREDWVRYSFVFREADAQGGIPALARPNNWVIYTV